MRTIMGNFVSKVLISATFLLPVGCHLFLSDVEMAPSPPSPVVTCAVARRECTKADATRKCALWSSNQSSFEATACMSISDNNSPENTCMRQFCGDANDDNYSRLDCVAHAIANPPGVASAGVCTTYAGKAAITYEQRYARCLALGINGACDIIDTALKRGPTSAFECVDLAQAPAVTQVLPTSNAPGLGAAPGPIWFPSAKITGMVLNDPRCQTAGTTGTQSFKLNRTSVGTVAGAGLMVPIVASQGLVTSSNSCNTGTTPPPILQSPAPVGTTYDPPPAGTTYDPPPTACTEQLNDVKLAFDDVAVSGVSLTGLTATSVGVAKVTTTSPGQGIIAPGGLKLAVAGLVNGAKAAFAVANSTPWTANIGATSITLAGDIDFIANDGILPPVNVKATLSLTAPKATAEQVACAELTGVQSLFGFEERVNWRSTNAALSYVDTPTTQGCGALGVSGQGFLTVESDKFATSALTVAPALSVDLYVPSNQPNIWWLGDMHMYLTCASAGVNNQFIGQVGLTGLPTGTFSTLRFPLPAAPRTTLSGNFNDCSLSVALNVNQTGQSWILDNLRFTQ